MTTKTVKPFENISTEYTQVHNFLFDSVMPNVKPNAWKVLCLIVRKTNGWHKMSDAISYRQIAEGAGIGSLQTAHTAVKELLDLGYIIVTKAAEQWQTHTYSLNRDYIAEIGVTEIVTPPVTKTVTPPVTEIVTTKEKERKEKEGGASSSTIHDKPVDGLAERAELNGIAETIADICAIKIETATDRTRNLLKKIAVEFWSEGERPATIEPFRDYWWGDTPPRLKQFREEFNRYKVSTHSDRGSQDVNNGPILSDEERANLAILEAQDGSSKAGSN